MGIASYFLAVILASAAISSCFADGEKCEAQYKKIGCYQEKKSINEDLVVFDRHNVNWGDISTYLAKLACDCAKKVKLANDEKTGNPKKYVAFSLHYYGECYGLKAHHWKALESRAEGLKHQCIGNQSYASCEMEHSECTGTHEAEYVYEMVEQSSQDKNVDGGYSEWMEWTKCTPDCGQGVRLRERTCTNPKPEGKGKDCSSLGESTQHQKCFVKECPVDGGFTEWKKWNECSKPCGGGVQKRTRSCTNPAPAHGGQNCEGKTEESRECNTQACPVDGGLSNWGSFTQCTKSCGVGTQRRYRGCTNPKPQNGGAECVGKLIDEQQCNKHYCPVHGGYSSWLSWSSCTKTCGTGSRTRTRHCNNPAPAHGGGNCQIFGSATETRLCNTHACPVPISSEYTARTCEGGTMHISCSHSRKIMITYASYGRKTKRHCGKWHDLFWSTSCHASSSWSRVRDACESRSSCSIPATNGKFGDPCWGTWKYLEVRFRCKG